MRAIEGLEPKLLWEYFAGLSAVPRCSKHEERAASFVLDAARRLGLEALRDAKGNVIVRKAASSGREGVPGIALQCHLDMVCEKNSGTTHDFGRDPIVLKRTGGHICADGTTLGADNGIGVAACLAVMEDTSLRHGPLEFVFTVDEETGLTGAAALGPESIRARTLINLDTEDEGVLYVGCAGGCDSTGTLNASYRALPRKHVLYLLRVYGLRGGHSGIDIHAGRANAIKLLYRLLMGVSGNGARICCLSGGNKRNAIPREAEALVALPDSAVAASGKAVVELERTFKNEFEKTEKEISVSFSPHEGEREGVKVLESTFQERLLNLLGGLPHGVIGMSRDIEGLVETSTNLARLTLDNKRAVVETSQRSSVESRKHEIVQTVRSVFALAGAEVVHGDGYPAWKPDLGSPVLKIAKETSRRLFGRESEVKAVHAGLECGIIGEKFPGMDMVSMGPTIEMAHSPEERVSIESVRKFWDFLTAVLDTASS